MFIRRSIRDIENEYYNGTNKKPLEDLIRAFKGIQELPPDDLNSLFVIGGYHGEPFRGGGWGNPAWWGGFCNHGNVLFPPWHRAYLLRLENALRSIRGCEKVTLPYWDETDDATREHGLPGIFLMKTFQLDGKTIANPLYSYTFNAAIFDNLTPIPDSDYSKPKGYTTVRYPFSGLVGPADIKATEAHNAKMNSLPEATINKYLNENVQNWLGFGIQPHDGKFVYTGTRQKFAKCLEAPNYTVFSNTTSATQWNEDHFNVRAWSEPLSPSPAPEAVVPLESPHNDIHLSIGGFDVNGQGNFDAVAGANGDMGENDTAGFDPIFYFHHCFIDKMFWTWQQRHNSTKKLDIIQGYPGTNSVDSQGPTPGVAGGTWLGMDSPMAPFMKPNGQTMIASDVVDIEKQLNYTYPPHFFPPAPPPLVPTSTPILRISGISRASISGSFYISIWAGNAPSSGGRTSPRKRNASPSKGRTAGQTPITTAKTSDDKRLVAFESILSRWHTQGCANCQNHLAVKAFVPLEGWTFEQAASDEWEIRVHTRGDREGRGAGGGSGRGRPGWKVGGMVGRG